MFRNPPLRFPLIILWEIRVTMTSSKESMFVPTFVIPLDHTVGGKVGNFGMDS
ncbi:hypothetical protein DPMN_145557 [Dreissena polymorpha]|uniref:Uncharacterized protein n=1 Tax=Dreissena polymorpha TaxID=45954 RepID=A0A9D4F8S4_DREPO|nr:hypothetical protein DPMN_145534 [Dreissena polymorpha]KAH3792067.1 hypothetical protein DPMN_145557 [Dreissena polymorpha]